MPLPIILAQAEAQGGGELFDVGGTLLFLATLLIIVAIGLFLFALADAIQHPDLRGNARLIWIIVIAVLPLIGPILYLTIGRKKAEAEV